MKNLSLLLGVFYALIVIASSGVVPLLDEPDDVVESDPGTWTSAKRFDALPVNAVYGGYDTDGSLIYVGRAEHEGGMLAASIVQRTGYAYVANYGKKHQKTSYDYLVGDGYSWIKSWGGHVPSNAVTTGKNKWGETMFIGRANYKNTLTVGKVHPSEGLLYIPYGKKEVRIDKYELLIRN